MLRVFATVVVVLGHGAAFFKGLQFTQWPNFPYIQSMAVVLFFCISGYTIAWVIDTRYSGGLAQFGRFIFDRFTRLAIPLLPVLILFACAEYFYYGDRHPLAQNFTAYTFLGNLLFLQNMRLDIPSLGIHIDPHIHPFGLDRPLWTIGVEFWIYVGFGSLVCALLSKGSGKGYLIAISVFVIILIQRYILGGAGSGLPAMWLLGAGLYYALKSLPAPSRTARSVILVLWILATAKLFDPSIWPAKYSMPYNILIFIVFALLVPLTSGLKVRAIVYEQVVFMGGFAYTTYLVHYPIMQMVKNSGVLPLGSMTAVSMSIICLIIAWIVSIPFEQNYKEIRNWIWQKGSEGASRVGHRLTSQS